MSTSTAPHDLAGIKHALELGLILSALILVAAAHGDTRQDPDFAAAPGIASTRTPCQSNDAFEPVLYWTLAGKSDAGSASVRSEK
jgi:hypothetical protein